MERAMAAESNVTSYAMKPSSITPSVSPDTIVNMLPQALSDIDLRPAPLIGQLSTREMAGPNCNPGGNDSGYASQVPTPERLTPQSSKGSFPPEVAVPSRGLFPRKVTALKPFDKEIPKSIQHRFCDLKELFDKSLYHYLALAKPEVQLNSISIKLMVLGENEASAKPWVVILCDPAISKSVKKYFNQRVVRQELRAHETDSELPPLDLVVCKKPPRLIGATEAPIVYSGSCDGTPLKTLCGTTISVSSSTVTRYARIGGVVKVTSLLGDSMLYAMTAGHILRNDQSDTIEPNMKGFEDKTGHQTESQDDEDYFYGDDDGDDDDDDDDDGEFEIDLTGEIPSVQGDEPPGATSSLTLHFEGLSATRSKLGHIALSSYDDPEDDVNRDWALIELDDWSRCRPNLISVPETTKSIDLRELLPSVYALHRNMVKRRVVVLGCAGNVKHGMLSMFPSFLLLAPGKSVIKTHTLNMDNDSELSNGDCGSWVINHQGGTVYGHVVASDIFREAYVVPLDATFSDISRKLVGSRVSLPTTDEVEKFVADHCYLNETNLVDSGYSTMNPSPVGSSGPSPTPSRSTSNDRPPALPHLRPLQNAAQMEASSHKAFSRPKQATTEPTISPVLSSLAGMRHLANKTKQSPAAGSACGRHSNEWLFGGFNVSGTVKRVLKDDEEK